MITSHQPDALERELRHGIDVVRGALIDLYADVGADPATPQTVSRSLGINRNLAWKLSRVIVAEEPLDSIEHLPRPAAVEILLEAFERAGAASSVRARLRAAVSDFDAVIDDAIGDRSLLELIVGPMLPPHRQAERDQAARKLAFRGNSAIWGIQAAVRLSSMFMAPNPEDPDMVDVATVGGLIGYRRLRSGVSWPLLRVHGYEGDGSSIDAVNLPLDPAIAPGDPPLMPAFCTADQPAIITRAIPGGQQFDLGPGPLGNRGLTTSIFGVRTPRFASCWGDEANAYGEQLMSWSTPVEHAVVDLIVHRDLPFDLPPTLRVAGRMTPGQADPVTARETAALPLAEAVRPLGSGPARFVTPLVPDYPAMTDAVFTTMQWDPEAFAAWRVTVAFPPIPTVATLRFGLGRRSTP
ncbi:MAG: hypothetical protein AB8G96_07330 [Phycisphaerales bacterium]